MNTIYETENITLSEKLICIIRDNLNKDGSLHLLKRLDNIIKWDDITEIVTRYLPEVAGGYYRNNKVYTLIKCLILGNIFQFSDYRLFVELAEKDEYQIFIGIDSPIEIPRVKIISSFRSNLTINSIYEMVIEKFNEQLIEGKTEILDYSIRNDEKKQRILNGKYIDIKPSNGTKIFEIEDKVKNLNEIKLSSILTGINEETANDLKDKLLKITKQIESLTEENINPGSENYQKMLDVEKSIMSINGIAEKFEDSAETDKKNGKPESDDESMEKLHHKIIKSFFLSRDNNGHKDDNGHKVNGSAPDNEILERLKYANNIIQELKDSIKNLDEIAASKDIQKPNKLNGPESEEQIVENIENETYVTLPELETKTFIETKSIPSPPLVIYPSKKTEGIFNDENLTEDYELGFRFHQLGLKMGFFNVMLDGNNESSRISTAEFFPSTFWSSVKQRSRWIAGICLQNWKAHKWKGDITAKYFMFRDRKPLFSIIGAFLSNIIFFYIIFVLVCNIFKIADVDLVMNSSSVLWYLIVANLFFMVSRVTHRFAFTYNWYGFRFAVFSLVRLVLDTFVNFFAVLRSLKVFKQTKTKVVWDATTHY